MAKSLKFNICVGCDKKFPKKELVKIDCGLMDVYLCNKCNTLPSGKKKKREK
jgi:predicted RNA-binding protein YlxR (DUF448 family)